MAYSGYGAHVYKNGERRRDKEDVGVFDTDEANLPSGKRIYANIMKNRERGVEAWWQHRHHGVLGDGPVRVALYKQGLPSSGIYFWPGGWEEPDRYDIAEMANPELPRRPDVEYTSDSLEWRAYYDARHEVWDYNYGAFTLPAYFATQRYLFMFSDSKTSESGHFEATMIEPNASEWKCIYDVEFGAGWDADE